MKAALSVVCWLLLAGSAAAQTVLNPTLMVWSPSPDHNATKLDGTAVVTRYDAQAIAMNVSGALIWNFSAGKPTPSAIPQCFPAGSSCCSLLLPTTLPITVETLYTMTVVAVGPDGTSSPTAPSNPFGVAGTRVPGSPANVRLAKP